MTNSELINRRNFDHLSHCVHKVESSQACKACKKNCDIGHRRIKKNNILIDLVIENQLSTFLNLGLVSKNWQILQQISKICSFKTYAQMEFCKEEKIACLPCRQTKLEPTRNYMSWW